MDFDLIAVNAVLVSKSLGHVFKEGKLSLWSLN